MKRRRHIFGGIFVLVLLCTLPACSVVKMQYELEKQNVPVRFYGRVVDQEGNPLSGVKVRVSVRHWGMMASSMSHMIRVEEESDEAGRFAIHGVTGDALDIDSVQKAGYELESNTKTSFGYNTAEQFASYPETPVIFKMRNASIPVLK